MSVNSEIARLIAARDAQTALIAQISAALNSKVAGGAENCKHGIIPAGTLLDHYEVECTDFIPSFAILVCLGEESSEEIVLYYAFGNTECQFNIFNFGLDGTTIVDCWLDRVVFDAAGMIGALPRDYFYAIC